MNTIVPVVLLLAALGTAGCSSEPVAARDASGAVTSQGSVDAFAVALGDCLDEPADAAGDPEEVTDVESVSAVPCEEPHDGEVYSVFDLPDGEFPGEEEVVAAGDERCLADFETFVGIPYDDSKYDFTTLFPSEQSWEEADDREYVCVIVAPPGERVTGSLKGAGA